MAVADRTVRQLRLRAATAAQARRGALCIEDALRCASLPDAGAQLLLVRRLALGRIDASGSSQTVALRIEQRLRALAPHWRHGDADDAGDAEAADAVWFGDRAQALACLVARLAEGRPASAWYWPRLLPVDLAPAGAAPTLRAALLALAREPGAPATVPASVAAALQRGGRARLRMALNAAESRVLMQAAGVAVNGADWIDALAARAEPPTSAALAAPCLPLPTSAGAAFAPSPDPLVAGQPGASGPARRVGAMPVPASPATPPAVTLAPLPAGPVIAPAPALSRAPPFDLALPTAAGGILFLLPLLARLGYVAAVGADEPAQARALTRRVLQRALQRLRLPDDDPVWQLLGAPLPAADDADASAARWLGAARHALRRRFGIGLASLVLRPAQLVWTRSHVDLHFRLADTDLRVRRHGLDLDPGWLPWFGRVVSFHFDRP